MTAYKLSGQSHCSSEIIGASVAEGKQRRRKVLDEVERRRAENYKRFVQKQRKIASEASKVLY